MTTHDTAYPLAALLRLRDQIRKQRELDLAAATRALEQARSELEHWQRQAREQRDELEAHRRQLFSAPEVPSAAERQGAERFLQRLEARVRELDGALARANQARAEREQEREQAREALATAEAELKAVQKNRDVWSEKRRRQALDRAEAELEDLVAARSTRNQ